MRTLLAGVVLVVLVLSVSGCATTRRVGSDEVEAAGRAGTAVLLDVRTRPEFRAGHIPGAVNIDVKSGDFDERVARLPRDRSYIVYCQSGRRSALAIERMRGLGFRNLTHFEGGMVAWTAEGRPVER